MSNEDLKREMSPLQKIKLYMEAQIKIYANFRYQRPFTEEDIKVEVARNPVMYLLLYGLPEEALIKGWRVCKKGTNETVKWDEKFQKLLRPLLKEFIKGVGNERTYGQSLFALIVDDNNKAHLRNYAPKDFGIKSDKFGNILSLSAKEQCSGYTGLISHNWNTEEELSNTFLSINRPSDILNQGKPYILPVWDSCCSLVVISEHMTIFSIRTGAGRIIVRAPQAMMNDKMFMDGLIEAAVDTNSSSGLQIVPIPDDPNVKVEIDIETVSASYNVLEFRKLPIQDISAYSGVPALRLDGAARNYSTADQNATSYLGLVEDIQFQNMEEALWFTKKLAVAYLNVSEDDDSWELKFNVKEELTEVDRVALTDSKILLLTTIMNNADRLEISLEDAMQLVDIDYKRTVQEPIERPDFTPKDEDDEEEEPEEETQKEETNDKEKEDKE